MDASLKKMLKDNEQILKDNLFLSGSEPSGEDANFFKLLLGANCKPSQKEYPSVWAWYSLMILFDDDVIIEWLKISAKSNKKENKKDKDKGHESHKGNDNQKENKKDKKHNEKKEHRCKDPFICDQPDNFEEKPEYEEKVKEQKNKHKDETSNVFLEIKPENEEENLDNLAKKVFKEIKRKGLKWSEKYEIIEFAFKAKKLIVGMNVEMDTSVQDIIDQLETWEEEIQSVDFHLFSQC
jgi:translation elongation factor EF-1beta